MRSHYGGTLRSSDIDTTVTLCGWVLNRRDHGGLLFLDPIDADDARQRRRYDALVEMMQVKGGSECRFDRHSSQQWDESRDVQPGRGLDGRKLVFRDPL